MENYCEEDSITYSVNILEHKELKDSEAWKNFLNNEVLAFKALERKNIKIQGHDAVISKVRENELCGYSINMIVENKYIANIAVRYKGECPTDKLILAFAEKVKF